MSGTVPAGLPSVPEGSWPRRLAGRPMFFRWYGVWRVFGPERLVHPGADVTVIRWGSGSNNVAVPVRCGRALAEYIRRPGDRWLLCEYENLETPEQRRQGRWGSS